MKEESIVGSLLEVAHSHISAIVERGEVVMDATLGNGHDTLFLAQCVGERGRVIGFDVQQAAIDATRERLVSSGVPEAVYQLHLMSHSRAGDVINEPCAAVMFNLGYLPGAEKSTITQTKTTLEAIRAGLALLRDGGILTVMCYPGHSGVMRKLRLC
ncbi:MAG: class I SAM-dependent methyltransferase [Akkermansiaceae bacterium]